MGGWTRIWVVITAAVSALAAWNYVDNIRSASQQADAKYKNALDWYDGCQKTWLGPAPLRGASETIDQFMCGDSAPPRSEYLRQQAQQRDAAIAQAKGEAATTAASVLGWVSGTVGALFIAFGWVWRGFRSKKQG